MAEQRKRPAKTVDQEAAVLEAIAKMPEPFKGFGERIHALVQQVAPDLKPRAFYGMPGYAKGGPVLCFFRVDEDFMTFGISEKVNLVADEGAPHQLIPSSWRFRELDEATEAELAKILRIVAA